MLLLSFANEGRYGHIKINIVRGVTLHHPSLFTFGHTTQPPRQQAPAPFAAAISSAARRAHPNERRLASRGAVRTQGTWSPGTPLMS